MTMWLRVIRASAEAQLRHLARDLFMLFSAIVQPFFIAVTIMFMLRGRPDFDPVYVVVGAGLSGLWTVVLFDGNWSIGRERWQGTLELLVASPAPLLAVMAGKMAGSMLFALISIVTSYVIGAWLFGYEIVVRQPGAFAVSFALGIVSLWSIAVFFSPLGILWRTAGRALNILEYPVYTLAGFVFPVVLLPFWLLPVSYALPPYWAAVALHGTSSGRMAPSELFATWGILITSALVTVWIASRLYRVVLRRARVAGSLALS